MSISEPVQTNQSEGDTGTVGATPAEMDDQASRPVEQHGADEPETGTDGNEGARADDLDADDADSARDAFEDQLNADRAHESRAETPREAPVDPPSGDFDPPH